MHKAAFLPFIFSELSTFSSAPRIKVEMAGRKNDVFQFFLGGTKTRRDKQPEVLLGCNQTLLSVFV
jgi:hypothetical protein